MNTLLTAKDYDDLLRDTRARVLVVSAPLFDRIATILPGQPYLEHEIIDGAAPGGSDARALDATLAAASPEVEAARTCADDFAFWLYTSGSTGPLKGAVHSHADRTSSRSATSTEPRSRRAASAISG